jgi:hypothetical protein
MAKPITTEDRLLRARALIQKAHDIPPPADAGWDWLSYSAQVKDTLRQAKDLLKFLPMTAGVSASQKAEVQVILQEIIDAEKAILHKNSQ